MAGMHLLLYVDNLVFVTEKVILKRSGYSSGSGW